MAKFEKILIANRGEIAVRIIRTAHDMGFRTVAVYSDPDSTAPHVSAADEAVRIGPGPVAQSYLCVEAILEAARRTGAEAVHPGYGFLSENADFARACADAGLTFIGPSPDAIALMASKRLSKQAMIDAGVPCIPGYQGADQTDATLLEEAERIGFPLMIKASAGGGGRGMRIVSTPQSVLENLNTARSEALSAFGSEELILERAIRGGRHIEVQIFADTLGNIVHLGERDCSIQRRHQKVVEESPSPFVSPDLRERLGEAATQAARACGYCGAGTVEFLVDAQGAFYFLEMNTRLQVEHPVTEEVTGQDLVAWQLRVALGEPLPLRQEEIAMSGWAMEVRLYAEDPQSGFMPQTGRIAHWHPAEGNGLRIDAGIIEGQTVSPYYDPMLAKLIAHGATREDARRKLARAIEDTALLGLKSNKALLSRILRHPVFQEGAATTDFLGTHFAQDLSTIASPPTIESRALAVALLHMRSGIRASGSCETIDWRNSPPSPWRYELACNDQSSTLTLIPERANGRMRYKVRDGDDTETIEILDTTANSCAYVIGGIRKMIRFAYDHAQVHLGDALGHVTFRDITQQPKNNEDTSGTGQILAPMDGAIVAIFGAEGDQVSRGETIAVLEAMKMERPLVADTDGTLTTLAVAKGDQVRIRQHLATISPNTDMDTQA
ncbi:MAG: acetyl/propionyl/methylcrotonyl-CoA carboxylase subunit alpha [Rhodobacteraceae bacterium]|nr:acetyl/propionyl/methylcrotonyl-CoA carboxylase subunit alpha [Paracoccaceae bacterium]